MKIEDHFVADRLLRSFDRTFRFLPRALHAHSFTDEQSRQIMAEAREEYRRLIPETPYIGGNRNRLHSHMLMEAAHSLALYNVLKKRGFAAAQVGPLIVETLRRRLFHYPRWARLLLGRLLFTRPILRRLRNQAAASQKREYPDHWVFRFVEGDGRGFDFGVDYEECAIVKFYRRHQAVEFAPCCCQLDFPLSEAFGWKLLRTTTIAEGGEKCDFRYKRT
jgi:hypothetical protein